MSISIDRGEDWLIVFYAMVAGDFCRYYLDSYAVFVYLAIGIVGVVLRDWPRSKA